jgi:hypothetical protein
MNVFIRALIASAGIEGVGALLLALADPHDWDTARSLGFLLHYPAEILLQGRYEMWAVFLIQGLLWWIAFTLLFLLLKFYHNRHDHRAQPG